MSRARPHSGDVAVFVKLQLCLNYAGRAFDEYLSIPKPYFVLNPKR